MVNFVWGGVRAIGPIIERQEVEIRKIMETDKISTLKKTVLASDRLYASIIRQISRFTILSIDA